MSSFLHSKDFARRYAAAKQGIDLEAVSEQDVSNWHSDLSAVAHISVQRENTIYLKFVIEDDDARDTLILTVSHQVEYDSDVRDECDDGTASGYFNHLQAKYGPTGYLCKHNRWNEWTELRYHGKGHTDREAFVSRFKTAKVNLNQALGTLIEPRFELLQFFSAISGHPEGKALLASPLQKYNQIKDQEEMEELYGKFTAEPYPFWFPDDQASDD